VSERDHLVRAGQKHNGDAYHIVDRDPGVVWRVPLKDEPVHPHLHRPHEDRLELLVVLLGFSRAHIDHFPF